MLAKMLSFLKLRALPFGSGFLFRSCDIKRVFSAILNVAIYSGLPFIGRTEKGEEAMLIF
ncbi:hypothetical protein AQ505_08125 [Pedobacter sp. PACM 27299]|nr:hypothetical protein AQ505_08125 [Pedobacter sp. PACM 27299]